MLNSRHPRKRVTKPRQKRKFRIFENHLLEKCSSQTLICRISYPEMYFLKQQIINSDIMIYNNYMSFCFLHNPDKLYFAFTICWKKSNIFLRLAEFDSSVTCPIDANHNVSLPCLYLYQMDIELVKFFSTKFRKRLTMNLNTGWVDIFFFSTTNFSLW